MKCGRLQDTLIHNEALQDKSQAISAVSASFIAAFLPHDPSGRVRHEGPMASSCQAREAVCGQQHMHLTQLAPDMHAATPEGLHTPSPFNVDLSGGPNTETGPRTTRTYR